MKVLIYDTGSFLYPEQDALLSPIVERIGITPEYTLEQFESLAKDLKRRRDDTIIVNSNNPIIYRLMSKNGTSFKVFHYYNKERWILL